MTNSKTTKRALLSSTLALLMCVAMLIGTTFAWFTDTASTAVNKIQAGTLDIGLEMWDGEKWVTAEGETLNFKAADGRTDILWEPGCTYELPKLRVINYGDLALRYKVIITGINGDAKLNEAIEWKAVFPVDEALWGVTDSREIVYDLDYWYGVNDGEGPDPSNPTRLLAKDTVDAFGVAADVNEFTIRGHMKETAGNEYQGLSIDGIAITVCATQMYYEKDSYNDQYDAGAEYPDVWDGETATAPEMTDGVYHITNAAEFAQYINELNNSPSTGTHRYDSAKVVLDSDIDLAGAVLTASGEGYMFSGSFDGNGHTVSNFTVKRTDGAYYTGLFSVYMNGGTIKNLTVKNATVDSNGKQVAAIVPSLYENATVENCHAIDCKVSGVKKVGAVAGLAGNGATVKECSAKDCSVSASNNDVVDANLFGYANGGTFEGNIDNGGNTLSYGE